MLMYLFDKTYIRASINFCKTLDGPGRVGFISDVLEDYYLSVEKKSPALVQRRFRELYAELIKNFGH